MKGAINRVRSTFLVENSSAAVADVLRVVGNQRSGAAQAVGPGRVTVVTYEEVIVRVRTARVIERSAALAHIARRRKADVFVRCCGEAAAAQGVSAQPAGRVTQIQRLSGVYAMCASSVG